MRYRLFFSKSRSSSNNNLLIKMINRHRLIESGSRSISSNPYLLRSFKRRFGRLAGMFLEK